MVQSLYAHFDFMEPYISYWKNLSLIDISGEIWKTIEEFPNYRISQYGRVKSLSRWIKIGQGRNKKLPEIILKSSAPVGHYVMVGLYKNGENITKNVHAIVAQYFIDNPNPDEYDEVNHIDGNKHNPYYKNLVWTDGSGNQKHAYEIGLKHALRGEKCPTSKLTNKQIIEIYNSSLPNHELAKIYPVQRQHVWQIKKGIRCESVTGHKK